MQQLVFNHATGTPKNHIIPETETGSCPSLGDSSKLVYFEEGATQTYFPRADFTRSLAVLREVGLRHLVPWKACIKQT